MASVKKDKSKSNLIFHNRRQHFIKTMECIFDIAHNRALDMITPEDREFLLAQREKGRRGYIGNVDKKATINENRMKERKKIFEKRQQKFKLNKIESNILETETDCGSESDA